MTLGSQFVEKINKQFVAMQKFGTGVLAQGIIDQMEQNVDRGVGFDPDQSVYKRSYEKRTIRERKRLGFQTQFADLQRSDKRVKSAYFSTDAVQSTIRFKRGGSILFYHQWGVGHNPRRQLFPDVIGGGQNQPGNGQLRYANSMPIQIVKNVHRIGAKLMNRPV